LRRGTFKAKGVNFFTTGFLSELGSGLFLWDGLVIGLSRVFRSLCIPLGISVEDPVLEIVGLDFESGLTMGDFLK
jgi:hypothetical protein